MRTASVRMAWRMAALVGALCLAALVPPATAVPVAPPVPTTGWLLDEGAGLTLSQYRGLRTGTMGGPVLPPQWSADVPLAYPGNWSLQFAPTGTGAPSNWCELQGHSSGSKGTVAFWVKDTDGGAPHYVLDASDPSRTLMYSTGPTTLNLYVNQTDLGSVNRSLIPGPGSGSPWTHVAIVWDNALATDKVKFYRNGVPQTSDFKNVNVGTVNPAYVYLGSRLNATEGWGGRLDEYALWNAALTADQIEWLAGHSLRQIPTRAPALPAAGWVFNEPGGAVARALFGGLNGTLYANVTRSTSTPFQHAPEDRSLFYDGTIANRVEFPGWTSGTAGSMSIWAYRNAGSQYLFDTGGPRSLLYGGFDLFLNGSHLGSLPGDLLPVGDWTHLLITWDNAATDGAREKVYKNGGLFGTFNTLLSTAVQPTLYLGNRFSLTEPWRGYLDEYALWTYALDREEIGWLYQNSLTKLPEPGTLGLLALGGLLAARRRRRARRAGAGAALILGALVIALGGQTLAAPIAPSRPDTCWLLDEGSGITLGEWNGFRTGTLGGPVLPVWSSDTPFGYAGDYSLQFAPSGGAAGNWADVGGHWSGTQGTVAFWVKDESGGGPAYILDASGTDRTLMYRGSAGGPINVYLNQTSLGSISASMVPGPADGSPWTHIAMVWDSSDPTQKEKFYKNGVLQPAETKNVAVTLHNPATVHLGSRQSHTEAWGGKIDEYGLWNRPLSGDEIAWLAANSLRNIPSAVPRRLPTVAWPLDEGSGNTTYPFIGTGNGTLNGTAGWTTNKPPRLGNNAAIRLDGSNGGNVTFPGSPFGTQGSLQVWAYANWDVTQPGWRYLLDASSGARTLLAHDGTANGWALYLNNTSIGGMTGLIPQGQWTHLVLTWDNSLPYEKEKVYKNGDLFATFNVGIGSVNPATLFLGSANWGAECWNGNVDEYALWDYALSPAQVEWLFENSIETLPEPGTLALLGLGGLLALRRRRRR